MELFSTEEDMVPGKVEACRDDGAHADRQKRETLFARVESIYSCENYGVGLEENVENSVCKRVSVV